MILPGRWHYGDTMLNGILSTAAAERIKRKDLAGAPVEYEILHAGLTGEVRYRGEFLVACVGIGPDGIIPKEESNGDDNKKWSID